MNAEWGGPLICLKIGTIRSTGLARGAGDVSNRLLPTGSKHERSDAGSLAYHGPCPNIGEGPHRYTFRVCALSVAHLDVGGRP
ncbi:MAG: hypothetical protein JSS24_15315, partial [Proteobacteria bacterium]|nr:hypothetical protein [Pseudomonadota bacterium]